MDSTWFTHFTTNINYYADFMIELGYRPALHVESLESKFIVEQAFKRDIITRMPVFYENVDRPAYVTECEPFESAISGGLAHSIITPRFKNKDSGDINKLYYRIKELNKDVIFYDQAWSDISIWPEETPVKYRYRGVTFHLNKNTVIPSHYANSQYIDMLLDIISERGSAKMLDLCTGSGCIGVSCLNESANIRDLLVSDISEHALSSVNETIASLALMGKTARAIRSYAFDEMPSDAKFDLITANPPHQNRVTPAITDRAGGDPGWGFHRSLFAHLHERLTENGIAVIIENGGHHYSNAAMFEDMIRECGGRVELFKTQWIPGSEWYLIYLRAVRP